MELFLKRTGIYLIAILLALSFFKVNGFFSNKKSEIIKSDGLGYYSYLPALFIYGDYSQDFVKNKFSSYYVYNGMPDYMELIDNKLVDKYFLGTAVLMSPFFMTAHLLSSYFHLPADGYSILYQYFIGLSAVFYVFIGIFFCERLLRQYGASINHAILICSLFVFGTNLYYYSVVESSMSHAFSFAMISAFLFYTKGIIDHKKSMFIIPAFICLGFVILIRPFNILIILAIPFLAGGSLKLLDSIYFISRKYIHVLSGVLLVFLILSLQFIMWYKQTGQFIVYSYNNEQFYFNKSNVFNVLISYKKGLFVYTPLLLLSIAGFVDLFRKNKFAAGSLFLFFALLVYVMSCWHVWYYGASFGFRPMIEYFALFSILLFYSFNLFKKRINKIIFILLCICALYINQVQAYQYRNFILHWDHMSSYKYWRVFLKTDDKWRGYVWDNPERSEFFGEIVSTFSTGFENPEKEWLGNALSDISEKAHGGKMVTVLDSNNVCSNTIILGKNSKLRKGTKAILMATGYVHNNNYFSTDKLNIVVSYQNKDDKIYYYRHRLVDYFKSRNKGWKHFEIALKIDSPENDLDVIKIYFWNPEKKSYWIDDVTYSFMDLK